MLFILFFYVYLWIFLKKIKPLHNLKRFKKIIFRQSFLIKNFFFFFVSNINSYKKKNSKKHLVVNSPLSFKKYYPVASTYSFFSPCSLAIGSYTTLKSNLLFFMKNSIGSIFLLLGASGFFLNNSVRSVFHPLKYFKKNLLMTSTCILLLPIGFFFFNVFLYLKKKTVFSKSAGTYCQVLNVLLEISFVLLSLPSKKKIYLNGNCICSVGRCGNLNKKYEILGGAKHNISLHKKPTVRGVAKNPVDHPHGGRTKTNKPEVSPWGWVTKNSH